jgi:hypothetical protein
VQAPVRTDAGVPRPVRGYSLPMDPSTSKTVTGAEGALAGVAATVVMTALLEAGRRWSSFRTHPPTRIVRTVLASSPDRRLVGEAVLAGLAHLGYGAGLRAAVVACWVRPVGAGAAAPCRRRSATNPVGSSRWSPGTSGTAWCWARGCAGCVRHAR